MKRMPFYHFCFAKASLALAEVIYIMVITTFIYQKTASALIASLFPFLQALSNIIGGFLSPLIFKKYSYRRLFLSLPLIRAGLLTLLLIGFDAISTQMVVLLLHILIISFITSWEKPILQSVIPKIVLKEGLVKANSFLSFTVQSAQIAGYSFTGFAVIHLGHKPTLVFNTVLIWTAFIAIWITAKYLDRIDDYSQEDQSKWDVMREGWLLIWKNQTLRLVTLMDSIEGMAGSIWIGAITLVYVKEALNQGELWWGFINASYYFGSILGGLLTIMLAKVIQRHLIFSMATGSLLFSIFTLIYGLTNIPILALLLCVAMGPAYQVRDVAQQTAFQLNTASEHLPKVYASQGILLSLVGGLSIFLMGLIADTIGVRAVYIFGSCLIFISALVSLLLAKTKRNTLSSL
ncbi:MFS transporter [Bacillus rubiinfantis]|uniref:MFS transporter n=1 Tax=Bacillus rubiinfantis TaxID=1499680 RepID=UPI0005A64E6C|nr:MFS transporter [Bacillus rubiinfantis]